jgi:hypothetical protein
MANNGPMRQAQMAQAVGGAQMALRCNVRSSFVR